MTDYDKQHEPFEVKQISGTEYDIHVDQVTINVKTNIDTRVVKATNSYLKIASLDGLNKPLTSQYYIAIPVHFIMNYLNE